MSVVASSSSKVVESQWSHLPSDILKVILNKLNNCLDVGSSDSCGALSIHNLRLRFVCKSWRSSISIRNKTSTPFSILPNFTFEQLKFNPRQGHYTLSQSTIYLMQKHQPSLTISKGNYWLLRVEEETSPDGIKRGEKWRPLNPLSRTLTSDDDGKERRVLPKGFPKSINLHNFNIFEIGRAYNLDFVDRTLQQSNIDDDGFVRIDKVVVSSTPFNENTDHAPAEGDYVAVMAICGLKLFFLKIGDEQWIPVYDPKNSGFVDVVFHRGEFYALDYLGMVVSVGSDLKAKLIAPGFGYLRDGGECKNLVTCGGDLFMINTSFQSEPFVDYDYYMDEVIMQETDPVRLEVYKLNEEKKQWERVCDLNNHVFFVGYDCSYSVFAGDFVGLKPNCVYYYVDDSFRDCNEENKLGEFFTGIGVYDLDAGTCGPLSNFPDHWPIFMPPTTSGKPDKPCFDSSHEAVFFI